LRVGVNSRLLLKDKLEGIGYFTLKNLERLTKNHPECEFVLFFDRPYDKEFVFADNVTPVVIPLPTRHPMLWHIYFEILLPIYIRLYKIDIFFSTEGYIPTRGKTPKLCTIHDINFEHEKTYIGNKIYQRYMEYFTPRFAKSANAVLTVSNFSKQDLVTTYSLEENKIFVVESSANEEYKTYSEEENQKTKEKYSNSCPYFYFVGSLQKRKNLTNLFKSFDIFKSKTQSNVKLLIVGSRKWWKGEIEDTFNAMRFKDEVVFTGRLPLEEVNRIASASIGLVFVSFFEGFGVPPLEAYRSSTAVITSNTSSMPEIAGEGAIYVNPYDVNSICDAMIELYSNPSLRESLIKKGQEQAKKYSWDKTAELVWNAIEKVLKK
jgi:glycosyltransferase involved in cell wall biosynthesis